MCEATTICVRFFYGHLRATQNLYVHIACVCQDKPENNTLCIHTISIDPNSEVMWPAMYHG